MNVYLCGGINGLSDSACHDWRKVAKSLLITDTLDPMRRDYRGREGDFTDEIVNGDLDDIQNSMFLLVNATRPSWGTAMELVYAFQANIPIFAFAGDGPISPWLTFHCEQITATVEEAVALINEQAKRILGTA